MRKETKFQCEYWQKSYWMGVCGNEAKESREWTGGRVWWKFAIYAHICIDLILMLVCLCLYLLCFSHLSCGIFSDATISQLNFTSHNIQNTVIKLSKDNRGDTISQLESMACVRVSLHLDLSTRSISIGLRQKRKKS